MRDWALEAIFKTEARDPLQLNGRSHLRSIDFKDDRSETSSAGCTYLYLERRSFLSVMCQQRISIKKLNLHILITLWFSSFCRFFLRPVLLSLVPNNTNFQCDSIFDQYNTQFQIIISRNGTRLQLIQQIQNK